MNRKIILIGGPSHTGKSSLAQALATSLNMPWRSTDSLAKHPGRPWKKRFEQNLNSNL